MRNVFCFIALIASVACAQKLPKPTRLWSVGPLTMSEAVMGIAFGPTGPTKTRSIFSATRSIAFAKDRIIVASDVGVQRLEGHATPTEVTKIFSLDEANGQIRDQREVLSYSSLSVFSTDDGHVVITGQSMLRLTPELRDDGIFSYTGGIENASPDGTIFGNGMYPGYQMIDGKLLYATPFTKKPISVTSINDSGIVTDNVHWLGQYPKDTGFVTYYDAKGDHLLYHGACGGRPQFLTNDVILEPGCKHPFLIDTTGKLLLTINASLPFSYAGVSQNGERFALQLGGPLRERFVIYSVKTGEPITEVKADQAPEEQSWTAFSPDGKMFVVGSPLKLTLYKLP
jgi:hypothetical protein